MKKQKEILKAVINGEERLETYIHGTPFETVAAWLAISDAVVRALEEAPVLKGGDQRKAMLEVLAQSFKDNVVENAKDADNADDDDDCDDDDCNDCDSQEKCDFYNKAVEHGLSKDEAMLLTLLGKIIGGKK